MTAIEINYSVRLVQVDLVEIELVVVMKTKCGR